MATESATPHDSLTRSASQVSVFSLDYLLASWERSLRAKRKSARTVSDYVKTGRQFADWLARQGMPTDPAAIRREHVEAFIVSELDRISERTGRRMSASSAATHYRRLQQLFRWLDDEGEIAASPMAKMSPPTITEAPVPVIPIQDLRALLDACKGTGFTERRDTALVRLLVDSGGRRGEVANIRLDDINWPQDMIRVIGKGAGGEKPRDIPFGAKTADSLDRYVRARARHPQARLAWLWLGGKGRLTDSGLAQILTRRSREAGIGHVHPHMFRHTMSHRWLTAGGQEGDLMRINGWSSRDMLDRYAKSAATERARKAHRDLALGDEL